LLGYASSGVNPDALLFAVCAALLCCLARAFRRGLTRRLALGIGALVALGFLSKLNFVGAAPGALLGLVLLTRRAARSQGTQVYYRWLAPALAIALSPGILYGLVNLLSNHRAFGIASSGLGGATGGHGSLSDELSYIWQFYLPRLPGMRNDIGEVFVPIQIWFRNFVGMYGWSDTPFPGWVYNLALIPASALALLCGRALVLDRDRVAGRVTEIVTYAIMAVGLMLLTAASGYLQFPAIVAEFTDARYALPMLALWAAVLALAARGAGRRWGPAVGALIVALVLAHDIFSQLQVIARYYG
jgi:4-amino-4-deoxy-L-arabinose transferase-like glycosyltransferase